MKYLPIAQTKNAQKLLKFGTFDIFQKCQSLP